MVCIPVINCHRPVASAARWSPLYIHCSRRPGWVADGVLYVPVGPIDAHRPAPFRTIRWFGTMDGIVWLHLAAWQQGSLSVSESFRSAGSVRREATKQSQHPTPREPSAGPSAWARAPMASDRGESAEIDSLPWEWILIPRAGGIDGYGNPNPPPAWGGGTDPLG